MNPVALMVEVIKEHAPEDIWIDSPLIGYRSLGNTNRGDGISTGVDKPTMPPVEDILETNNRRIAAEQRLDVLNRRIDGV